MPRPTQPVAVKHPTTGQFEALDPAKDYPADSVFVKAYPWAFRARETKSGIVESVAIEKATAEPGEKRSRRS
jgi:hypothetical protein